MKRSVKSAWLGIVLIAVSWSASGEEGHRAQAPFVGVFSGQITEITADARRCPNPFQPLRVDVRGQAQTTLGRASFSQSHCEDTGHTVFSDGTLSVTFDDGTTLASSYQGSIFATPSTAIDGKVVISGRYRHAGGTGARQGHEGPVLPPAPSMSRPTRS